MEVPLEGYLMIEVCLQVLILVAHLRPHYLILPTEIILILTISQEEIDHSDPQKEMIVCKGQNIF